MIQPWPEVVDEIARTVESALRDRPRIGRAGLVKWARGLARERTERARLTHGDAVEIDGVVDAAMAHAALVGTCSRA